MNNPATLRVKFPASQWPGWHVPEFSLTSRIPAPDHDFAGRITVSVDPDTHSDYCSDSPVFRASIEGTEDPVFALKFAMREDLVDDLEEEGRIYCDALQTLQGTAVPRCFGMFTGMGEEGQPIACLVLEYWGECLQQPFQVLSLDLKIQILERLGAIHREGLLHGDFAERNVLLFEGDVRIIDFDQTESGHDCHCKMDFTPGEKLPDMEEFGCDQLFEICRYLRIWDTPDI
ncbi:hypothetical protein C8F04DRAFT_1062110 [Mycena alexandri]|uniref:non-specific serine/threonine protein kinase n=1 Tax=Mycena alexandri TaxID=1745969 RepID=A0AAD6TKA9_9AGAR|nr:hypothetical protein C8F04DRAFT_1062110 [Mycena alexandri]